MGPDAELILWVLSLLVLFAYGYIAVQVPPPNARDSTSSETGLSSPSDAPPPPHGLVDIVGRLAAEGVFKAPTPGYTAPNAKVEWWKHRNAVGATLFHFLILTRKYDLAMDLVKALKENGHLDAARWLLSASYEAPKALNGSDSPDGSFAARDVYRGENALHMLIAQRETSNNLKYIRFLVKECPALVHGRAYGAFFQKCKYTDQRSDDTCNWGEYPLSFAVSINEPAIVEYLVNEAGADMLAQDSHGNTCLHSAVINKAPEEMVFLLRELWTFQINPPPRVEEPCDHSLFTRPAFKDDFKEDEQKIYSPIVLDHVVNAKGYTALILAALLDSEEGTKIFQAMIRHDKYGR
jgi:hypothetical protein